MIRIMPLLVALILVMATAVAAQEELIPQKIGLHVGEAKSFHVPFKATRVSVAAPEIADVIILSPYEIYLTGKSPGATSLFVWDGDNKYGARVEVAMDTTGLKEQLHRLLPDENIKVTSTKDSVLLWGEAGSTVNQSIAMELAQSFAPGKVVNLMRVGGVQQVMLEVRVSEMGRSLLRSLGINFAYLGSKGGFAISRLGRLINVPEIPADELFDITASERINHLFRFFRGNNSWTGFIDALKEEGLVKILAEPNLTAISGQEAEFLVGGEFPIPVAQSGSGGGNVGITIEWKTFGVGLSFTPTVLSEDKISLKVAPEVSELDFTRGVNLSGFTIPGLTTRRAATTIELAPEQGFAIAGLLQERLRENISKFPFLGDVPILGALFQSKQFQKNESELVIVVTPHLVKPIDNITRQALPTDSYIEPSGTEFYLQGAMEGKGISGDRAELEGEFGHLTR